MNFNTKIIKYIQDELNGDASLFAETPFYKGASTLKKANLKFGYSEEELNECVAVSLDIMRFVKHCSLKREDGSIGKISLRKFQEEYLKMIQDNKRVICMKSRQVGTTTILAIHSLYMALLGKPTLFITNLRDSGIEVMDKIKMIYSNLEFYMKPGIISWNQTSIKFDNGGSISTLARPNSINVRDFECIYIDEAAYIPWEIISKICADIISNGNRVVIQSNPNGLNHFHNMYINAIREIDDPNKSGFVAKVIYWYEVEGRDEAWKQKTIKEIGGIDEFNEQYGLMFKSKIEEIDIQMKKLGEKIKFTDSQKSDIEKLAKELSKDSASLYGTKIQKDTLITREDWDSMADRIDKLESAIMDIHNMMCVTGNIIRRDSLDRSIKDRDASSKGDPLKVINNPGQVEQKDVLAYLESKKLINNEKKLLPYVELITERFPIRNNIGNTVNHIPYNGVVYEDNKNIYFKVKNNNEEFVRAAFNCILTLRTT